MNGYLRLYDGKSIALPELLTWEMKHTDGQAADSFSLMFRFSSGWEAILKKAVRFYAKEGSITRFCGVVDEYTVTLDARGTYARLYGRGMAGLLMDNQVAQRVYYYPRLRDMVKNYVTAYGIEAPAYKTNPYLTYYGVEYGETAWEAFCGFCRWTLGPQPRFTADGTLDISGNHGECRKLGETAPVLEVQRTGCRYGVYSAVSAKYLAGGYTRRYVNTDFEARGGCAEHRMTVPRRFLYQAGVRSPQRVLEESAQEESRLKITLRGNFYAQPMDEVVVNLPKLGLAGTFLVRETENRGSIQGKTCTLDMYEL